MASIDATVKVPGLNSTVKALSKVDDQFRKEAGKIVRIAAIKIKNESFARSRSAPGVRRAGYPFGKGAYIRGATATRGWVGINRSGAFRNATVLGAEFGAKKHKTFGRHMGQASMKRRTFPVWRGNSKVIRGKTGPGWIMLPVLRRRVPELTETLSDDLRRLVDRTMRKAGA